MEKYYALILYTVSIPFGPEPSVFSVAVEKLKN
jgi:hypothetical protein